MLGKALNLPGGANANAVDLPDNLLQGEENFSTSFWVRPDTKANWIGLFHIGDGLAGAGSFFQIQMQTQAAGNTGLAATFKAKGSAPPGARLRRPGQGRGRQPVEPRRVHPRRARPARCTSTASRSRRADDLTIDMADIGPTSNNWLGRNGFPDPAYDGLMDDVRLYTSTLSADDVVGAVRRRHGAAHDDDGHGRPGLPVAVRGARRLHGHGRG